MFFEDYAIESSFDEMFDADASVRPLSGSYRGQSAAVMDVAVEVHRLYS